MIRRKKLRDYTEKQYRIKKKDEYSGLEHAHVQPSAYIAFKHKPYSNDYNDLRGDING